MRCTNAKSRGANDRNPAFSLSERQSRLGLGDLTALDALRAQAHALGITLSVRNTHAVQVRKEAALRDTGGEQTDAAFILGRTLADDGLSGRRALSAHLTYSRHCLVSL